jgi:transaldolase
LENDQLSRWISEDCLRGVTSNPTIFQQAIAGSSDYAAQLFELAGQGRTAAEIYDQLTLADIRAACDLFRPLYVSTSGQDGFVSHEVSPELAYDTWATIHEARRLWAAVDRPNVLIKIPATTAGLPAIRQCLAEGINVNITLMFSLQHYDRVAEAYLQALEDRVAQGLALSSIASVASFFVSRVDTFVDRILDERLGRAPDERAARELRALRGQAAVANAKRAYRRSQAWFTGERFTALAARGARLQRPLWASTGSKDPQFSDVKYVEALIGPHTVNTVPLATLEACRDHLRLAPTLEADLDEADGVVAALGRRGIDLEAVGEALSRDGVAKFQASYHAVLETVEQQRQASLSGQST